MWRAPVEILSGARQLADAFEKRDAEAPFDLVQSADYFATGHYVKPRAGRPHVVRSSMARELLARVDQGDSARTRRWWIKFELEQMRRAEIAYAPSEYAAAYFRERLGRVVHVVRPPGEVVDFVPGAAAREVGAELPEKFLLHFGQLRSYKGTPWLLDALAEAWKQEPGMTVVLVGPVRDSRLRRRLDSMKEDQRVVRVAELPRAEMYGVIQKSVATVLPSLADNFPNTVLESLALGVPVIGGRGASVDELVEDGKTGELVELGDVKALARSMVRAWRGELPAKKGFVWESGVRTLMEPARAVRALGEVAGIQLV
jgi:glycosyltransferase involved in cell wall biosynthesis